MNNVFKFNLKVISPIHIGTGEKLKQREYFIDSGKLYIIDPLKMINNFPLDLLNRFINTIENKEDISQLLKQSGMEADKFSSYSVSCKYSPMEILPNIKSIYKNPYITGSTIKGFIRTSILASLMKNEENMGEIKNSLEKSFKKISSQSGPDRKKIALQTGNDLCNNMEKIIFSRETGYDVMRALQVSDTSSVSFENLEISEVRVLSVNLKKEAIWKNFKLYPETLNPYNSGQEVCFQGSIKLDNIFFRENSDNKQSEVLSTFPLFCRNANSNIIDKEIRFFRECGIPEIEKWYENLKDLKLEDNQFLLHLGWGTGFDSKTITHYLSEELIENIRRYFGIGKKKVRIHIDCDSEVFPSLNKKGYYFCKNCMIDKISPEETISIPFPKSRKLIFNKGKPCYPLGWTLMTLEKGGHSIEIPFTEGKNDGIENINN